MEDNVTLESAGSINTEYYKGDDFDAFDNDGIKVDLIYKPDTLIISRAELRVGKVLVSIDNPEFPIVWSPSSEVTEQLDYANECYLAVYDDEGRKRTCQGSFTFICKEKEV